MINLSLLLRPLITYAAAIVITPQTRAPLLLTILHNTCNNMLFSDGISLSQSTISTDSSHVRWKRIANSTCFSWFSPNSVSRRRGGLAGCNYRRLSAVDHDHDDLSFFVLSLFLCESLSVRGFRTKRLSRKQNKTKSPTKRRIGDLRIISLTEEEEFGSRCTATNKQTIMSMDMDKPQVSVESTSVAIAKFSWEFFYYRVNVLYSILDTHRGTTVYHLALWLFLFQFRKSPSSSRYTSSCDNSPAMCNRCVSHAFTDQHVSNEL
jgi:hypothetical protein